MLLVVIAGLYMAWNIGANDVANAMATSYGSRALTLKQIVIIAGLLEFLGAVLFGQRVTHTIAKGIVPIDLLDPKLVSIGALASLLAASLWITIATYFKLPVSTTHSIVGAVLGFGLATASQGYITLSQIKWSTMVKIVLSWIISPIAGGILGFIIFYLIKTFLLQKFEVNKVENVFKYLQVLTACYVAFAHGSNDVANATGPIAACLGYMGKAVPVWILVIGGFGIVLGIATWGYKVIETIGEKITGLTHTRGFAAQFSTATTVLCASYLGMPISTTHTIVGSVIGVGLTGGLASVDLRVVGRIIASWISTVPVVVALAIAIYGAFSFFAFV